LTRAAAWTLALASVGSFMVALDGLVVTTALASIRADVGAAVAVSAGFAVLGGLAGAALPGRARAGIMKQAYEVG
jgi:hypothetical protein